jgi:hypothetical protein
VATSASGSASQNEPVREARHQVGADHVERAVREVDHVHDAEHEREPGSEQEQHQPELQPVEGLFEKKRYGHAEIGL